MHKYFPYIVTLNKYMLILTVFLYLKEGTRFVFSHPIKQNDEITYFEL